MSLPDPIRRGGGDPPPARRPPSLHRFAAASGAWPFFLTVGGVWVVLWTLGFPAPNWDDLFFVGGALELAEHGRLANPLIRFWNPAAAERYFFQPPFFQYALAGWIHLAGVSSASLRAFQCLAGAMGTAAVGLLLHRHGFSRAAWVVPVLWAVALSTQGLRHDALGLALLATGLLLLTGGTAVRTGAGSLLLTCSLATWPVLLAYAVPLSGALLGAAWRRSGPHRRARLVSAACIGALAATALFLLSIGGEIGRFLADFAWHAKLRGVSAARLPAEIWLQLTNGYAEVLYLPLYTLLLAFALVLAVRWREVRPQARALLLILGLGMTANLLLYASTMHPLLDLACWIAVVALAAELPLSRRARQAALAASLVVFLFSQAYLGVRLLGTERTPATVHAAARTAVAQGRAVGVDEVAARFVFDYRLPSGAFFWNYSVPPPQTWPTSTAERSPSVTWILSPVKGAVTRGISPGPPVRLFGRTFRSIPARPYDVVVLPAAPGAR